MLRDEYLAIFNIDTREKSAASAIQDIHDILISNGLAYDSGPNEMRFIIGKPTHSDLIYIFAKQRNSWMDSHGVEHSFSTMSKSYAYNILKFCQRLHKYIPPQIYQILNIPNTNSKER